jgi:hypothetical protein
LRKRMSTASKNREMELGPRRLCTAAIYYTDKIVVIL